MSFRAIVTSAAAMGLLLGVSTSAVASVRPGSAVPTAVSASTASSSAQGTYAGAGAFAPWPAYVVIALTLAVGVWFAVDDPDSDTVTISRG